MNFFCFWSIAPEDQMRDPGHLTKRRGERCIFFLHHQGQGEGGRGEGKMASSRMRMALGALAVVLCALVLATAVEANYNTQRSVEQIMKGNEDMARNMMPKWFKRGNVSARPLAPSPSGRPTDASRPRPPCSRGPRNSKRP